MAAERDFDPNEILFFDFEDNISTDTLMGFVVVKKTVKDPSIGVGIRSIVFLRGKSLIIGKLYLLLLYISFNDLIKYIVILKAPPNKKFPENPR